MPFLYETVRAKKPIRAAAKLVHSHSLLKPIITRDLVACTILARFSNIILFHPATKFLSADAHWPLHSSPFSPISHHLILAMYPNHLRSRESTPSTNFFTIIVPIRSLLLSQIFRVTLVFSLMHFTKKKHFIVYSIRLSSPDYYISSFHSSCFLQMSAQVIKQGISSNSPPFSRQLIGSRKWSSAGGWLECDKQSWEVTADVEGWQCERARPEQCWWIMGRLDLIWVSWFSSTLVIDSVR